MYHPAKEFILGTTSTMYSCQVCSYIFELHNFCMHVNCLIDAYHFHNCLLFREGADTDFGGANVEATFASGTIMIGDIACASISIIDDSVIEGDHSFTVSLSGVSPSGIATLSTELSNATVNIEDNDGMVPPEFLEIYDGV